MNTLSKASSPAKTGAITVAIATFIPGFILSFCFAYLSAEPNWKFGRDGAFQLCLFIAFWLTICNVAAFLATIPLYYWWRLPRTKVGIILHSIIGTVIASCCFYFGLPTHLAPFLPHGTLSNNGVTEIIVLTTIVAVFPFLLVMVLHAAIILGWRRSTKTLTSQST